MRRLLVLITFSFTISRYTSCTMFSIYWWQIKHLQFDPISFPTFAVTSVYTPGRIYLFCIMNSCSAKALCKQGCNVTSQKQSNLRMKNAYENGSFFFVFIRKFECLHFIAWFHSQCFGSAYIWLYIIWILLMYIGVYRNHKLAEVVKRKRERLLRRKFAIFFFSRKNHICIALRICQSCLYVVIVQRSFEICKKSYLSYL